MTSDTKKLLESVATWPAEDQEALAEAAREIEARRNTTYDAGPDVLAAIDQAIRSADEGRFATDQEVAAIRAKFHQA
jgi:predicted transcriptional regulator